MASVLGQPFPDFEIDRFSTRKAWSSGPMLLIVWRADCPTCQMTLPFIERMHKAYRGATVVGVSQEAPDAMQEFLEENGYSFPNYSDSNLTKSKFLHADIVPAIWVVDRQGKIRMATVGWDRNKIEEAARILSSETGLPYGPIVKTEDQVPVLKPG